MEGLFVIAIGVLNIFALRQKWHWFMEFYQCRKMRERYGESGFAGYVYLMCSIVIVAGFYMFFRDL